MELTDGAAVLREAATKARELAQRATPPPWHVDARTHDFSNIEMPHVRHTDAARAYTAAVAPAVWPGNADHIAAWHPAVALAIADGLEGAARHVDAGYAGCCEPPARCPEVAPWLAAARVFLGRTP